MSMTFSIHESIDPNAFEMTFGSPSEPYSAIEMFPIVKDKLRIPKFDGLIDRPRINKLLDRSCAQFPATLISGRSGTGKTAIASTYALANDNVAWYTVGSNDTDWSAFSRYFAASLLNPAAAGGCERAVPTQDEIAGFLARLFCTVDETSAGDMSLLVVDDIHHLFDAAWFDSFFNLLLYSLPQTTHLMLLCRSKPPGPLWRLRSKQMLNVLDEKVIAFDVTETGSLLSQHGLSADNAESVQNAYFGRVAKLLEHLQTHLAA